MWRPGLLRNRSGKVEAAGRVPERRRAGVLLPRRARVGGPSAGRGTGTWYKGIMTTASNERKYSTRFLW